MVDRFERRPASRAPGGEALGRLGRAVRENVGSGDGRRVELNVGKLDSDLGLGKSLTTERVRE